MNPPPIIDADGHEYPDRRHEPRREDDEEAILRGYERWVQLMFFHRGKVMVTVAVVTWFATALGFRWIGPSQEIARVERKLDTATVVWTGKLDTLSRRVANVEKDMEQLDIMFYMQCTTMRRTDPAAVPSLCNETRRP